MSQRQLIAALTAIFIFATVLVGCTEQTDLTVNPETTTTTVATDNNAGADIEQIEEEEAVYTKLPESLTAEKLRSFDSTNFIVCEGGVYYRDSTTQKYGILSFDGSQDTGAIYDYCASRGKYFEVITTLPDAAATPAAMNCVGLVDSYGQTIVEERYAAYTVLNKRFVQVYQATEQTDDEDEALIFASNDQFGFVADDDDTYYKGNWYVIDLISGKKLSGATGTNNLVVTASGNYVTYYTDEEEKVVVNNNGEALPENAVLFSDGSYLSENAVYDTTGNKLFDCDPEDFVPAGVTGDYYYARKTVDYEAIYVIMGKDGTVLSAEFSSMPNVCGDYVRCDGTVTDFEGNEVAEESEFDSLKQDPFTKLVYIATNDDEYIMFDHEGNILHSAEIDDDHNIDTYTTFLPYEKSEGVNGFDNTMYYCLKDDAYTLDGNTLAPFLIRTDSLGTYDVVDAVSGEVIIEGYDSYSAKTINSITYVYAKAGGTTDIYTVKA